MASFTEFESKLLVACFLVSEASSDPIIPVRDAIEKYALDFKGGWIDRALEGFISSGLAKDTRTLGSELEQEVWLTAAGFRAAEQLQNQFELYPVSAASQESETDRIFRQIVPASDRTVTPMHNVSSYIEAVSKVEEARRIIGTSNQLPADEKEDSLLHLEAGISILKRANHFTVGTIRYLVLDRLKAAFEGAIEDAFKAIIVGAFMALAAILISML